MRFLFLVALSFGFVVASNSQTQNKPAFPPPSDPNIKDNSKDGSKDDARFGSPEAEMRSKLEIKEEKKKYDEHLARAKEAADLASQISHSFETSKSMSGEDQKRFERLEKLTKRIRNDAGGENKADADLEDIPAGMDQTLKKISEMADELQKLVENTPRNVISAAVIDQANKLLTLIQRTRGTSR
jgi:hypothetical protein